MSAAQKTPGPGPVPAGSTAVMARRVEPHDSLDYFATPPWGARALVEHVTPELRGAVIWEPAAGGGYMARGLADYAARVVCSDVHDYGDLDFALDFVGDFLWPSSAPPAGCEWIVTNPPFRLAQAFALRALETWRHMGLALLCRTQWAEGGDRWRDLFNPYPPGIEAVFVERLPINKGPPKEYAGTATSYSWFVWPLGASSGPTRRIWIPPCRKMLERPGDYAAEDPAPSEPGGLFA